MIPTRRRAAQFACGPASHGSDGSLGRIIDDAKACQLQSRRRHRQRSAWGSNRANHGNVDAGDLRPSNAAL
jgi:hypothetical protein